MKIPLPKSYKPRPPTQLEKFITHAKSLNLDLLKDDEDWLKDLCYNKEPGYLRGLLTEYIKIWQEEMKNEPLEHKKQNKGRFSANTYIRIQILGS